MIETAQGFWLTHKRNTRNWFRKWKMRRALHKTSRKIIELNERIAVAAVIGMEENRLQAKRIALSSERVLIERKLNRL